MQIKEIEAQHPGTVSISLPLFEGLASDVPLSRQVQSMINWLDVTVVGNDTFSDGYHFLCHSQGALRRRTVCGARHLLTHAQELSFVEE